MIPLGEAVGKEITRSKKVWVIVAISFLIGVIITVAEPDLQVLAGQVPSIPDRVIIWSVALGVGVFLVIALLRILFAIQLSYLLIGFYAIVFVLAGFVSPNFWAVAFDSGGVTTGPITVPFIMALGVGVSAVRNDREAGGDSFGLVALCSIGPIITVLLLGLLYQPDGSTYTPVSVPDAKDTAEMFRSYTHALPEYFKEIFLSLAPILAFFVEEDEDTILRRICEVLAGEGAGHTFVLHAKDEAVVRRFALTVPVSRFLVNVPASLGGIGAETALFPALTLGCGAVGGSSSSNNIGPLDLINLRRVAWGSEKPEPQPETPDQPEPDSALIARLTEEILKKLR